MSIAALGDEKRKLLYFCSYSFLFGISREHRDVLCIVGKEFLKGIQRCTLREVWSRTRRGRRIIPELLHPDIFTDIGAFLMGNPRSNRLTLNVGSPSSVPIRFQRYLGWFWGRKASLVRGESRGSCFVFLF